ncbi:ribokinase [Enterococcus saccharolyticus]|uniref:Ribokinase n=1 Tax=Candidatus Enterococcus willemsii TaxID=1857215 RepID=A0ABQ6YXK1_9ENTE|nr:MULTISPECIES: ribokinase [Enterococcus]KAF1302711.1 ribokinase [Enterococcus sp. CU12B]MCD5002389.1 ribokinase [Enterococcus saccharolyticus]
MSKILVVGSMAVDLTVEATRMPKQGETIKGHSIETFCGGKGANQAVAIARLGGQVDLLGCVGKDAYGQTILANLENNLVGTHLIGIDEQRSSGTAHIFLVDNDNRIIVVAGANESVTPQFVHEQLGNQWLNYDLVVLQNEIPHETIDYVMDCCQQAQVPVLYNPAPTDLKANQLMDKLTFLTPNETECRELFPELSLEEAAKKYPNKLIITLGANGVMFHDGNEIRLVPAEKVVPVDTTGAGDTFNGAFALAIVQGKSIDEAIQFGNKSAALSVTKKGAQEGMPRLGEIITIK